MPDPGGAPRRVAACDYDDQVSGVLDVATVHAWDSPMLQLDVRRDAELYLRIRGMTAQAARAAAAAAAVPVRLTKRGALIWARRAR